ncbi:recombinase family protein [Candidatus Pacearchaeota archaeon]|jgi:site-specific DNA recombinase|nr:recombinase family protein [Candidatus Pacearchaeota archaeon]
MSLLDRLKAPPESELTKAVKRYAFAYLRVSHLDSAESGTSIETQRRDIEAYAKAHDIEIVRWYDEPGRSAYKNPSKRVEFSRMISDAISNPIINLVIVWKSDRFFRNKDEAAATRSKLLRAGVRVISVLEPYDTTTVGGIVLESVTDAMNQARSMELSIISHRNLATNAQQRDAETGWAHRNGGRPLFGYKNVRIYEDKDRKYQRRSHCIWLKNDEIHAGREIWQWARTMLIDWRLGEGLGYDRIAKRLTEFRVPTCEGLSGWSHSTVMYMLRWDMLLGYAGYSTWNKAEYCQGGKRIRPPSEWIVVPDAHPAIITLDEAEAIDAMKKKKGYSTGASRGRWLLSGGLTVCVDCGANFASSQYNGKDHYVCGSHLYRAGAGCISPAWRIPRETFEAAVFDAISKRWPTDKKELSGLVKKINKAISSELKIWKDTEKERNETIKRLDKEISRLTDALARGVAREAVETDINNRLARKKRLEDLTNFQPAEIVTEDMIAGIAETVRDATSSDDRELRRRIIRQYVERIDVYQEKHEAVLIFKDGFTSALHSESVNGANASRIPHYDSVIIKQVGRAFMQVEAAA